MSDEAANLAPVITWRSTLVTSVDCSTCKLVGLVLSLYMNERGGSAFPSNARLADDCSLGVSTVREHLNSHLFAQGWLTLIERGGTEGSQRKANEWQASTPRQLLAPPRQETASPPPANSTTPASNWPPSSPLNKSSEVVGGSLVCSGCGDVFTTADGLCDHIESDCPVLNDDDFTPAGELTVIEGAA